MGVKVFFSLETKKGCLRLLSAIFALKKVHAMTTKI